MKIKNTLYEGDITLDFNTFKHAYSVEGEAIPSVTKILSIIAKPALINWSANMAVDHMVEFIKPGESYDEIELGATFKNARKAHWQKKTDAGDIGTLIHNWIENYINGENPGMPVNTMLSDAVNNFLGWVKRHDVKFLLSEQPVYSKKYKYAGIIDFICTIDDKLYIGDTKTSKGIYKNSYGSQVMAYMEARKEEFTDEDYAGFVVVRIGKDGSFETWIETEKNDLFYRNFINALNLYGTEEEIKEMEKNSQSRKSR